MSESQNTQIDLLAKKLQADQLTPQEIRNFKDALIDTRVVLPKDRLADKLIEIEPVWRDIYKKLPREERAALVGETVVYIDTDNWVIYINGDFFPKEFEKYPAVHEAEEHVSRTVANASSTDEHDRYHLEGLRAEYQAAKNDGQLAKYHQFWVNHLNKLQEGYKGTRLEEIGIRNTNKYLQERAEMFSSIEGTIK